jgi:cytochrome c biogenesis protein CcmG/thiol:disulfide interchange protein DsbE
MNRLKYFVPLLAFLILALFLMRGIELDPAELPSPLVGKPLPDFSLPALEGDHLLGRKDLTGKAYLLNVWATWCPSCKMEHPYLLHLAKQGVMIVGINYKDDSSLAGKWLENLGNPYVFNIVDGKGSLGLDLGVFGAPETFLIDQKGIIRYKHVGIINERVWKESLLPVYQQYSQPNQIKLNAE